MDFQKLFYIISRIGSRYYLVAGIGFLVFYFLLKNKISLKKIQLKFPKNKDYGREIFYSSFTVIIFGVIVLLIIGNPTIRPYTQLYNNISDKGWLYYFGIFPLLFILHDTYFYWSHRIMHHKFLFKWVHLVHHKSTNPSPWCAYAFHPLEALVEQGIFILFVFAIPLHNSQIVIFFLLSIMYNVYGHLGWEIYPKGFNKTALGKWLNTSVSHNQHHQYFKGNYSLYFLIWDRLMGTLRPDYDQAFEEVKNR